MRAIPTYIILVLWAVPALAQENVVLPDLAPRVVEITGDLTISFPSLDRQPLVGFNPPPRVPELPGSRQPFTETYKQSKDQLPPSPLREPEAPEMSSVSDRQPIQGMLEAGAGRYFERYFRGHFSAPLNENTTLILAGQYLATDGYEPFSSDSDIKTNDKTEFISAGIRKTGQVLEFGGGVGIHRREYALFGAEPVAVSPSLPNPARTIQGWDASAWMETRSGSTVSARLGLLAENTLVETGLFNPVLQADPNIKRFEDRLVADGSLGFPVNEMQFRLEGRVSFQGFDTDGFPGRTVPSGSVAGLMHLQASELVTVDAGLRVLGIDALGQAVNGADRTLLYLSPDFRVTYALAPGTNLVVSNTPEVSQHSTRDLYYLNPYIEDKPAFQPVVMPTNFRTGIHLFSELFQLEAGLGWQDIKNFRYVESSSIPVQGFGEGFLTVNYADASVLIVNALAGVTLMPGVQANLEIAYRKGRLDDDDTVIPYFSPVTSTATLQTSLFANRLNLKFIARGESSRFTDRIETAEVNSLLLFNVEGVYYLNGQMGIVGGVRDLGNRAEFWANYPRETSVFYAGARWRW